MLLHAGAGGNSGRRGEVRLRRRQVRLHQAIVRGHSRMRLFSDQRRLPLPAKALQIRGNLRLLQRHASGQGQAALQYHVRLHVDQGCVRMQFVVWVRVEESLAGQPAEPKRSATKSLVRTNLRHS